LASNLKSGLNNLEVLWGKILAEVRKGRYVGPFVNPPFKNTICSPMGLVPKRDEASNDLSLLKPDSFDSWRFITHLSSPKGQSINTFIPPEYTKVKYASFDRAIKLCKNEGKGCYLAKTDLKSAFMNIPVHQNDQHLLAFQVQDYFFFDMCLPFGLSISCAIF
jgi:hypothetical protein